VAPTNTAPAGATVTGDPTLSGWTFTGDYATNGASKGSFAGYGPLDSSSVPVAGYAAGATADFLIVGWSANIGTTWSAAQAVLDGNLSSVEGLPDYNLGISEVGQQVLAPAGGPYNDVLGAATSGLIPGIFLESELIPEPCTFVLCGLGAATLVTFRRRNS
jgi:hypothetical protein